METGLSCRGWRDLVRTDFNVPYFRPTPFALILSLPKDRRASLSLDRANGYAV